MRTVFAGTSSFAGSVLERLAATEHRPVLVVTAMLLGFQNFNTFTIPYIMTGGGPLFHSEIVSNYIYNQAFTNLNFGLAAAASSLVTAMLMIFAIFYVRTLSRERL